MGIRFTGDWDKALELSKRSQRAVAEVLVAESDELAERMREGLRSGSPAGTVLAPLHPLTAALKGSQIPLAGMERWVTIKQTGPLRYFIGFTDPDGVRYGTIHEEGRTWSMVWTDRQRRWFFATMARFGLLDGSRGRSSTPGDGTVTYTIPARPWLEPIIKAYVPGAEKRIREAVIRNILR